jgi:hypothetical protein
MENKYKETESMIFYKEISDKYKKDGNQKDLHENLLKYKEIRSKEEIHKEFDNFFSFLISDMRDKKLEQIGI